MGQLLGLDKPRDVEDLFAGSIGYRVDGARTGLSLVYPFVTFEVPKFGGWVVPKLNVMFNNEEVGLDIMYTPSVSRWFEWYAALGSQAQLGPERFEVRGGVEMEIGIKFRFKKWWGGFKGFRIGTRWSGFKRVVDQRMVLEANVGAW